MEECPINTGVPQDCIHGPSRSIIIFLMLLVILMFILCVCGNSQFISELENCRENSTFVTLLFRLFWLVSARDLKMDMGILNEKATFKRL